MTTTEPVDAWSRRHLVIVLGIVAAAATVLIGALAYAVISAYTSHTTTSVQPISAGAPVRTFPTTAVGVRGQAYRDEVAAAPMMPVNVDDLKPAAPAASPAPTIVIPAATMAGPAQVPTGFAHTPEGAAGQLGAIDTTVLTGMSIAQARSVYARWAMSGAADFTDWEMTANLQNFHASAGTTDGDQIVIVTAVPVAAQIKGVDGPDWVLACVLYDIKAQITDEARIGYGRCEHLQWSGGRWMIAPGTPPAAAPSTWPGSQRSLDAGWRTWVEDGDH